MQLALVYKLTCPNIRVLLEYIARVESDRDKHFELIDMHCQATSLEFRIYSKSKIVSMHVVDTREEAAKEVKFLTGKPDNIEITRRRQNGWLYMQKWPRFFEC